MKTIFSRAESTGVSDVLPSSLFDDLLGDMASGPGGDDKFAQFLNVKTPTPLKNAMMRIKLKEEQRERLRLKSLALAELAESSGELLAENVAPGGFGARESVFSERENYQSPSKKVGRFVSEEIHVIENPLHRKSMS